jgi:ribosome-associated protein
MTLPPSTLALRGEYITLAQALKVAGLAETGGQAKVLVREGDVLVNGVVEKQPGRKLRAGDRFRLAGGTECIVTS